MHHALLLGAPIRTVADIAEISAVAKTRLQRALLLGREGTGEGFWGLRVAGKRQKATAGEFKLMANPSLPLRPPAPSSSHVPPEKIGGSGMVGRKGGGKTLSNSSIQPLSPPPSPPHLNFFFSVSSSSSSISGSARRFILGAGILCERTQNILSPPSYRRGHARHVSFSSV